LAGVSYPSWRGLRPDRNPDDVPPCLSRFPEADLYCPGCHGGGFPDLDPYIEVNHIAASDYGAAFAACVHLTKRTPLGRGHAPHQRRVPGGCWLNLRGPHMSVPAPGRGTRHFAIIEHMF
jgi:hypothetical protein